MPFQAIWYKEELRDAHETRLVPERKFSKYVVAGLARTLSDQIQFLDELFGNG